ncbi:MAG: L,D-transpeptidase family protein [Rhizobiaceae bacterium]
MKRKRLKKLRFPVKRITVRRAPGGYPHHGLLKAGWLTCPCTLGENGISVIKREGDRRTPAGRFALAGVFFHPGNLGKYGASGIKSGAKPLNPDMGWCDDPSSGNYNRPVKLPISVSHEKLLRDDALYDVLFVIDWNIRPRIRGAGSAIFMHIARPGYKPTEGCIALSQKHMSRLISQLARRPEILIYP